MTRNRSPKMCLPHRNPRPLTKGFLQRNRSSWLSSSTSTSASIRAPTARACRMFARSSPLLGSSGMPRGGSADGGRPRLARTSYWSVRAAILVIAMSLALAPYGCGSSPGGGGTAGTGGGGAAGAAAAGVSGGLAGRGGGGGSVGRGGAGAGGVGSGTAGGGGVSAGSGGTARTDGGAAGATGGGGRAIDDGGVTDGKSSCQASNPDPCLCGRPDASSVLASQCAQEERCRAAGGVWEPYIVFLPDGGEYGPRCQTQDGGVFDSTPGG